MVDYLMEGHIINGAYYAEELIKVADCEEKKMKVDSSCSALAR